MRVTLFNNSMDYTNWIYFIFKLSKNDTLYHNFQSIVVNKRTIQSEMLKEVKKKVAMSKTYS